MSNIPSRSPICSKALTLKELQALPVGAPVVSFFWGAPSSKPHKYQAIYRGMQQHSRMGRCVVLEIRHPTYGTRTEVVPPADLGLAPYPPRDAQRIGLVYRGWNVANAIVLPKDVSALPSGSTPEERLRNHS